MRTTTLRSVALAVALSVPPLWAGCSGADRPPEIRLDRTACARCGMLVSDLPGAAAYRTASGEVRAYDDLACLVEDRVDGVGRDLESEAIWVYDQDGVPVRASVAIFVRSPALHTPMGGGFAAFGEATAATAFAEASAGEVLRWSDLVAERSPAQGNEGER